MVETETADPNRFDLHSHTYYSDGTISVADLIQRASDQGVTHLAITDHDCTAAFEALEYPVSNLTLIEGVEISCAWEGVEVHLVGLFIDRDHPDLVALLSGQQNARLRRVETMAQKLEDLRTPGLMDYLQSLPAVSYTRSHVANFLVAKQVCKNRQKAFKSHLGKRGVLYVPPEWCDLESAISAIQAAGGLSVLAHPGRYAIGRAKLVALVKHFKAAGGVALEGTYPNIDANMMKRLAALATETGLHLSLGSDFHDPEAHWTRPGKFPDLDAEGRALGVWHHPIWLNRLKAS